MSTYTLKSIVRRGGLLAAAFALFAAAVIPAASTYADALNPLTDRSLTLSSSSPGWDYKDGSGNATYAPPNSGANGQKAGNTFSFKVSTDTSNTAGTRIHAMTFQYCTTSAGTCTGPGDIVSKGFSGTNAANVANHASDLEIVTASPSELTSGDFSTYVDGTTGNVKQVPAASVSGKNYVVYYQSAGVGTPSTGDDVWSLSPDWVMTTAVKQDIASTGKANYITLVNTGTDAAGFAAGTPVKVVFFGTDTNYITNPGSSWFFVKINTYSAVDASNAADPQVNPLNVIDGGVTVANVMNQSIQITTKVLETMDFSVGTIDPNTLSSAQLSTATSGQAAHTTCDRILTTMNPADTVAGTNTLKMGNQSGEFSLETAHTYSTHSYWRLSSNSSAGATVYYSGNTLSNTVGDKIDAIGATKKAPIVGSEQFGLAIANGTGSDLDVPTNVGYKVNYTTETKAGKVYEYGADDAAEGLAAFNNASPSGTGVDASFLTDASANASYHYPQLYPLVPTTNYSEGAGTVNLNYNSGSDPINTKFAFDEGSQTIPVAIATEDQQVVDCVTAKMRYVANIAATTPAGIYTTKVNYIAAPQY